MGYVDKEQGEGQRRYTLEDESVSLLDPFRLSLHVEPLLGESLYNGVVACYLIIEGDFNPVNHPVGINVLDTFRSPQGIPCPLFGHRSFAGWYGHLDYPRGSERSLACKQSERAGYYEKSG